MKIDLEKFYKHLNYTFKNSKYLKQALTHRSVGSENYERLEFLGDSILSFVIANELFRLFPEQSEGQLSRLRSFLVRGDMLAEIAKEISLGDFLFLGQGELKSGGFRRASTLADSLEAVIAAIFLDGGIQAAQELILRLFNSRLSEQNINDCLKDAKTQLQEFLQAKKYALPVYTLIQAREEELDPLFEVSCKIENIDIKTLGQGVTRRKAEQQAAKSMLKQLKTNNFIN